MESTPQPPPVDAVDVVAPVKPSDALLADSTAQGANKLAGAPAVNPDVISGMSGGSSGPPRTGEGTASRSESRRIQSATPEQRRQAMQTVVTSLGREAARHPTGTPENQALSVIGVISNDHIIENPSEGIQLTDPAYGLFPPDARLPRVRALASGAYALAYDQRNDRMPNTPSPLPVGVVEITNYHGKTRGPDGIIVHFSGKDSAGQPTFVDLPMAQATELMVLTQHTAIKEVESVKADPACATMIKRCEQFVASISASKPSGDEAFDIMAEIDDADILSALEKTSVSAQTVDTFAQNMLRYIQSSAWGGTAEDRAQFGQSINTIRDQLEQGIQPTSRQIQDILRMAALPKLAQEAQSLEAKIAEQRKAGKDVTALENSLTSLKSFQSGEPGSLYRRYLDAVVAGEVKTSDAQWLTNQLLEAQDPWAFLKKHDWQDKNCLAGKAFDHVMGGLDPEKRQEVQTWLSKFLTEHGQDIAMMGIFALFQMMSGIIGDAARKA